MAVKADDLEIRAGDGVAFKLALLEVEASAEDEYIAVPACIDVPPPPIVMASDDTNIYIYILSLNPLWVLKGFIYIYIRLFKVL